MTAQAHDREALQRQVPELARQADMAAEAYDRHDRFTWAGYAVIFLAIPFVVLLFRLHMDAWHYYVAGALMLASALVVAVLDLVAIAKRDTVIQAFERAQAESLDRPPPMAAAHGPDQKSRERRLDGAR